MPEGRIYQAFLMSAATGNLGITVTSYSTGLESTLKSTQIKEGLSHTPIKVGQSNLKVVCACPGEEYEAIQRYVAEHHKACLNETPGGQTASVRFRFPSQGMDYRGYIIRGAGGGERFEVVPTYMLEFFLIRDMIFNGTNVASEYVGNSTIPSIWSGELSKKELGVKIKEPAMKTTPTPRTSADLTWRNTGGSTVTPKTKRTPADLTWRNNGNTSGFAGQSDTGTYDTHPASISRRNQRLIQN